jgi:hypothetical protein
VQQPMILVQHIKTIWTKKSRGMPGAAKRNAIPRKLEILNDKVASCKIFIHEVFAQEWEDFNLEQKTEVFTKSNKYWTLTFLDFKDEVQILFTYDYYEHGQPNRAAYQKPLLKLRLGETGSLHINGRFSSYSGQYYKQHFVNIGNVCQFNSNLFLENEPNHHVDKMVHLF